MDQQQNALDYIVYTSLPETGMVVEDMGEFAVENESVKSASPIFAPLAGEITAVNEELEDTPELMNTSLHGDGWRRNRIDNLTSVMTLMSPEEYNLEIKEGTFVRITKFSIYVDGSCLEKIKNVSK